MVGFSNLIVKLKVNEIDVDADSFDHIFQDGLKTKELHGGALYEVKTESRSFFQLYLQAEKECSFFCRENIIEYFSRGEKISEFQVLSDDLESIHLLGESRVLINFYGNSALIVEKSDPDKFLLKTLGYPGSHEKVWNSHRDIRYHLVEAKEAILNNQLIVIFAGMGKPFEYRYNYSKALADVPCHKLFIIDDYGDRGSYYLGNNLDTLVETSVISLILNVASRYNIPLNNVLAMGSSKGGYSALYYGIKYSFGKVVAAAPQSKLGNYLEGFTMDMVKDMTGNEEKADVSFLNEKLFSLLGGNRTYPDIHLMVGGSDPHVKNHLKPLITKLRELKIHYKYEIVEGYGHNAFALFQNYFTQKTSYLILNRDPSMYVSSVGITQEDSNTLKCEVKCAKANDIEFAYYWYRNKEVIDKQFYVKGKMSSAIVTDGVSGNFDVIVFLKYNNSIIKLVSDTITIN